MTGKVRSGGLRRKRKEGKDMNTPTNFIVIAALLVLIIAVFVLSRRTQEEQFDERQLRVRADAFRIGFFSMLGAVLAMMVLFSWKPWVDMVDPLFTLIAAVMISFLVFAIYCITHDAFFRRKEKPASYLLICIGVMLVNLGAALKNIKNGTLLVDDKVTLTPCGNIMMGGTFLIVAIVLAVKMLADRREEEE